MPNDPSFQSLASLMHSEAAAGRYAGVAMIAVSDQVIFEEAAGLLLRSANLPITLGSRFQLASTSKLFTVIAMAQLIEQHVVGLDDSLTQWLTESSDRTRWSRVKVRHLLGHTSGFASYWGDLFTQRRTMLRSVQDYCALVSNEEPSFEPGTRFEYSNVGYILLGAIIERATGMDFFSFVQTHIFDPAGMNDTGYFDADEDVPNLAFGYSYRSLPEGSRGRVPPRLHTQLKPMRGGPAGDAVSTAPDLIRLCQALMAGKLVGRSTLEQLWLPLHPGPSQSGSSAVYRMGLGFVTIDSPFGNPAGHTGGFAGEPAPLFSWTRVRRWSPSRWRRLTARMRRQSTRPSPMPGCAETSGLTAVRSEPSSPSTSTASAASSMRERADSKTGGRIRIRVTIVIPTTQRSLALGAFGYPPSRGPGASAARRLVLDGEVPFIRCSVAA